MQGEAEVAHGGLQQPSGMERVDMLLVHGHHECMPRVQPRHRGLCLSRPGDPPSGGVSHEIGLHGRRVGRASSRHHDHSHGRRLGGPLLLVGPLLRLHPETASGLTRLRRQGAGAGPVGQVRRHL